MLRRLVLLLVILSSTPALAESDEISPVPVPAVIGQHYAGETAASKILFINVRPNPVKLFWIAFDGGARPYAALAPGEEILQPTYVAHRWIVEDAESGDPLEAFISTRSEVHDDGTAQIALIR